MQNLESKRVAIVATKGFEQLELTVPRDRLKEMGATVHVVSLEPGTIRGWDKADWGTDVPVDRTIDDVTVEEYDALVLPGGQINPDLLRVESAVMDFVKAFHASGKPTAAICHAPWLLIEAGVVKGRKATSYPSIRTDMVNAGANWVDEEVVVDGNVVTSRKPDDLEAFTNAIATLMVGVVKAAAE